MTDEDQYAITHDERDEIETAVAEGAITDDDGLAIYVATSTAPVIVEDVEDDVLYAKRVLAAEGAAEKPRKGLVEAMRKVIDDAQPDPDGGASDDGTRTIKRENKSAWWCPIDDHSNTQLTARCGNCGARRDGDTVTP